MPDFNETYRVFGDKLGVSDGYVDVQATGYALDGSVQLEETVNTSPRTFTVDADDLEVLEQDRLVVSHSDLSDTTHQIWTTLDAVHQLKDDNTLGGVADDIVDQTERLFRAATMELTG